MAQWIGRINTDVATGIVVSLFGAAYLFSIPAEIRVDPRAIGVSSRTIPVGVGCLTTLLGLLLALRSLWLQKADNDVVGLMAFDHVKIAILSGFLLSAGAYAYAILIGHIGLISTTFVTYAACAVWLGGRRGIPVISGGLLLGILLFGIDFIRGPGNLPHGLLF